MRFIGTAVKLEYVPKVYFQTQSPTCLVLIKLSLSLSPLSLLTSAARLGRSNSGRDGSLVDIDIYSPGRSSLYRFVLDLNNGADMDIVQQLLFPLRSHQEQVILLHPIRSSSTSNTATCPVFFPLPASFGMHMDLSFVGRFLRKFLRQARTAVQVPVHPAHEAPCSGTRKLPGLTFLVSACADFILIPGQLTKRKGDPKVCIQPEIKTPATNQNEPVYVFSELSRYSNED
jgi:hypothetical protein